jgi:hypothetical protein
MAEVLKEHGLFTGALLNYHYFDRRRRMDQGFDVYDNSNARLHVGSDPASTHGSSSREQADAAIAFIDQNGSKRFFLWVHFYDPHFEYEVHPGTVSFGTDNMARYDGEIRFTDDQLARVLARLDELGLTGKTIVAITGDHGEGFGEHAVNFHGYDLYAAQTKVPMIFVVPGLAPRRLKTPVGHVDLLPTFANLVGAQAEATMSGRSLVPFMLGEEDAERAVYQEVSYEGPTEKRALATRTRHLLYNMVPDRTYELYDLVADPGEKHDVWGRASDGDALAERLAAMIDVAQAPPEAAEAGAAALLSSPPKPRTAVRGEFGGAVRFLGADLPAEAHAGSEVEVVWYWESLARLPGNWKPFVHFESAAGGRFLGDHEPAGGALPVARWQPGQRIADRQKLMIPAGTRPGEYTAFVGWFHGGQRLPLSSSDAADAGDNRIRVGAIKVVE